MERFHFQPGCSPTVWSINLSNGDHVMARKMLAFLLGVATTVTGCKGIPEAPAIDVYDKGALLAGYVYESIDDCIGSITEVIERHGISTTY